MKINLNELLFSLSSTLDFVEMETLGVTSNHGKRVAYLALRMGEKFGFSPQELFDLVSFAELHDNALSEDTLLIGGSVERQNKQKFIENLKEHCTIGQENLASFPFLTSQRDIIKYHHEKYDGTGFFGLKGDEIPMMARIIAFANYCDHLFNLKTMDSCSQRTFYAHLNAERGKYFSSDVMDAFLETARASGFWLDLNDRNIHGAVMNRLKSYTVELSWDAILKITQVFSKIVDCKSKFTLRHSKGLEEKTLAMTHFYKMEKEETVQLCIAATLHDLGKLTVPNSILDHNGKLGAEDRWIMDGHTYYTRTALQGISGFEKITEWAANHHEKLDGSGYPLGLKGKSLDFNSRLIGCLDIYQALTEVRPYRRAMAHNEAMKILNVMGKDNLISRDIVREIENVLNPEYLLETYKDPEPHFLQI